MLPQMKKKGVAMIVASLKNGGGEGQESKESSNDSWKTEVGEKSSELYELKREKRLLLAEGVLEAVRTKDAEALADALEWFFECCEEE
jgi:hypothetical protein